MAGLDASIDGIFTGNELVSAKLFGLVRGQQSVSQDQSYILEDGTAGSDVRRGDPVFSIRDCASNTGRPGKGQCKLPTSHDPGWLKRSIVRWIWDSKTRS